MSKLTTAQRDKLASGSFVFPAKRAYPIPDASHARAALSMVAAHGTAAQRKLVRDKVAQRYPGIKSGEEKK
jgi:hypothetical protein